MDTSLHKMYPGMPDPTSQILLSVVDISGHGETQALIQNKSQFKLENFIYFYDTLGLNLCLYF